MRCDRAVQHFKLLTSFSNTDGEGRWVCGEKIFKISALVPRIHHSASMYDLTPGGDRDGMRVVKKLASASASSNCLKLICELPTQKLV